MCEFSRLDEQPVKRVVELTSWEALGVVKVRAQLEGSESGQTKHCYVFQTQLKYSSLPASKSEFGQEFSYKFLA